jgi:uncharacterized protein (UPF0332 family)
MSTNSQEAFRAVEKAKDAIETAEHDVSGGFVSAAVNRGYYAMYYCMTALLYTKDVYAKTHSGTIVKFNELFIQPGLIQPPVLLKYVQAAFNARQRADYDMSAVVTEDAALTIIANAKALYKSTKNYLLAFAAEE